MLVCSVCGTHNSDPGGDTRMLRCGRCGCPALYRQQVQQPGPNNNNALAGAVVGGTIGGVAGGPVGALFGIILGALVGSLTAEQVRRLRKNDEH